MDMEWERTLNSVLYAARRQGAEGPAVSTEDLLTSEHTEDEITAAVAELVARGLLRERGETGKYEITHDGLCVSDAADGYNGNPHTPLAGPTVEDLRRRVDEVEDGFHGLQDGHTL